jgi:hypothetical protein
VEGTQLDLEAEATHSFVRAGAGRVFVRLARVTGEGDAVNSMHIEFTPAQALRLARHLEECARSAIAKDVPADIWARDFGLVPPTQD